MWGQTKLVCHKQEHRIMGHILVYAMDLHQLNIENSFGVIILIKKQYHLM